MQNSWIYLMSNSFQRNIRAEKGRKKKDLLKATYARSSRGLLANSCSGKDVSVLLKKDLAMVTKSTAR
jgi:hypothetical protein